MMATRRSSTSDRDVNISYLESLVGYNARRASLSVMEVFMERMAVYGLKPTGFSVLSLIRPNPGITSRQLSISLGIKPPNLVGVINKLRGRELFEKRRHPLDGRAMDLHLTRFGRKLAREAEETARLLESDAAQALTPEEIRILISLLRKVAAREA